MELRPLVARAVLPACLAVVPVVAVVWVLSGSSWMGTDLAVYRAGSLDVLTGQPLYAVRPGLPFTYPPFAAVVLAVVAVLPWAWAFGLWVVASWAAYVGFVKVAADRLDLGRGAFVGFLLLGVALEPVWHTVALGQVNLLLALLVVLDTLVVPARWRGLGVGLAAGIKLTPAVFLVYFALRGEWRAALRALAALAVTVVVGLVVDPHDSLSFWSGISGSAGRVGDVEYAGNQSAYGVLARAFHTEHPPPLLWGVLAAGAVAAAAWAARRQLQAGHDLAALTCVAVGGLLASPISWSHHWVWLVPAVMVLVTTRHRVLAAAVVVVTAVEPMRLIAKGDGVELHQAWWAQLLCVSYTVLGVCFLVVMLRDRATDRATPQDALLARRPRSVRTSAALRSIGSRRSAWATVPTARSTGRTARSWPRSAVG